METPYEILAIDEAEGAISAKSGTEYVSLTSELGCTELRGRIWRLSPGDEMTYHRHGEQEELYVPLDGPGRIRVDDELRTVAERSVIRIPPETPRQLLNDTETEHAWLVVGAPPVEDDGIVLADE